MQPRVGVQKHTDCDLVRSERVERRFLPRNSETWMNGKWVCVQQTGEKKCRVCVVEKAHWIGWGLGVDAAGMVAGVDAAGVVAGVDATGMVAGVDTAGVVAEVDTAGMVVEVDAAGVVAGVDVAGVDTAGVVAVVVIATRISTGLVASVDTTAPSNPSHTPSSLENKRQNAYSVEDVSTTKPSHTRSLRIKKMSENQLRYDSLYW